MEGQIKNIILDFTKFKNKYPRIVMGILIFIIIPITASVVLGYEMKADVAVRIPTVVIDNDNSLFSKSYVNYIEDSQYFNVINYPDKYEDMEKLIFTGEAYVGVIIPENFYKDMVNGKSPKILTIYDGSTMAVIVSSKASMMETLLTVRGGFLEKVFEAKQNVPPNQVMSQVLPIDGTYRTLYNPVKSFRNFILPGLLVAIIQVSMAITGAERGFENQNKKLNYLMHIKYILKWSLFGVGSIIATLSIQCLFFDMPYRGTVFGGILITLMFSFAITLMGYIFGSFFEERAFCTQISCIMVLPTAILGGYTWPVLAMPEWSQIFVKMIPFTYYGEVVRNLCLKPIEAKHMYEDFIFFILFILAEILILILVLKIKKNNRKGVEV